MNKVTIEQLEALVDNYEEHGGNMETAIIITTYKDFDKFPEELKKSRKTRMVKGIPIYATFGMFAPPEGKVVIMEYEKPDLGFKSYEEEK